MFVFLLFNTLNDYLCFNFGIYNVKKSGNMKMKKIIQTRKHSLMEFIIGLFQFQRQKAEGRGTNFPQEVGRLRCLPGHDRKVYSLCHWMPRA
jgi:hypothetical protein